MAMDPRLVLRIAANFEKVQAAVESVKGEMAGLAASAKKFSDDHRASFNAVGQAAGLLAGAVGATAAAIVVLGKRGAEVNDVADAFGRMAGPNALGALRSGIGGLLSDFDLMRPMNAALSAGFKLNAQDAYTMSRAAWVLSDAQGKDLKASYDQIAEAMTSGKVRSLAALGVSVEQKGAALALKAALHDEGLAMSSSATIAANRQAAMEALNRVVLAAGKQELDFGERLTRVTVQISNMTDSLGVAIATSPVIAVAMESIGTALQSAFGADQTKTIQTIIGYVNSFAIGLVDVGSVGVSTAKYIDFSFRGLQAMFAGVMVGITGLIEGAYKGLERVASVGAAIEKITSPMTRDWRDLQATLKDSANGFEGMRKSFQAQASEAIDKAGKEGAAFDGVNKALGDMRVKMVAAAAQGVSSDAVATALAKTHGNLTDQTNLAAAAAKRHAAATAEHTQVMALMAKMHEHEVSALEFEGNAWKAWESTASNALLHITHLNAGLDSGIKGVRNLSGIAAPIVAPDSPGLPAAVKNPFLGSIFGSSAEMGQQLSATILGAIQGGGNPVSAAAGLVGSHVGSSIAGMLKKDGTKMFTGALGGVFSSVLPVVGSLIGPLADKLWSSLFGTAGRTSVVDFAASLGGFDALHVKLNELGAEGEALWIKLTQGVGRNDPKAAAAAIQAVTDALEKHKTAIDATATAATAAGDAQAAATAKAQAAVDELTGRITSLQQSIANEAPEEVMGIVEANTRAQIAAITAQRDVAQAAIDQTTANAAAAADEAGNVIDAALAAREYHIRVKVDLDGLPGGEGSVPGFQHGSAGVRDFGRGQFVVLHGREEVRTEAQVRSGGGAGPVTSPTRAPGGDVQVQVYIGNEQLDGRIVRVARKDAGRGGLKPRARAGRTY